MEFGPQFDLPQVPRPYHGKVFLLQELDEVVARHGLPTDDDTSYVGYQNRPFEKYIEVQVWDQHLAESV